MGKDIKDSLRIVSNQKDETSQKTSRKSKVKERKKSTPINPKITEEIGTDDVIASKVKEKKKSKMFGQRKVKEEKQIDYVEYKEEPTEIKNEGRVTGRKLTGKEKRQAKKVRKQNQISEKRKSKQIEDFRQDKVDTKEVHFDERSIWNKMLGDKTYGQFKEMGDTDKAISSFQKKRILVSLVILALGGVLGVAFHPVATGIGFVLALLIYIMKGRSVDGFYKNWKFHRQLAFSKFTRLVIPYLKSSGGNMALYTIFTRVVRRMEDPTDKHNLYQLMGEMGDDPTNIQPFLDFADRSSGTDMSHLFMTTIFDFQQSTFDVEVIDELGKMASDDMMDSVDEIIEFKLQRFAMFPTKIVMSSFLLVAGLAAGMMLHSFQGIGFGNMDIKPDAGTPPAQEQEMDDELDIEWEENEDVSFIINDKYYM